jgi:hypothetical protein
MPAAAGVAAVLPTAAAAQAPGPLTLEARGEAAAGRVPAVVAGAGAFVDAGLYVRLGATVAGGVDLRRAGPPGSASRAIGEGAVVARFLLDPQRQASRGVYAAGGVGTRVGGGVRPRPFLLVAVGVEGRRSRGGIAPAIELGAGGGARVAVALRRARADRR